MFVLNIPFLLGISSVRILNVKYMYMERLWYYKQNFPDNSILLFQKIKSFVEFLKVWSTIPAIYWKYKDDAFKLYYVNCSANNIYHPTTLLFDFLR